MAKVELHIPTLKELWFRSSLLADAETMKYNAGYDVNIDGYDYNSGCISFPEDKWKDWFNRKIKNKNFFYAYIVDTKTGKFVGETNFSINGDAQTASMGVVIKAEFRGQGYMQPALKELVKIANSYGVNLINDVPASREAALKGFYKAGFVCVGDYKQNKFGKPEKVLKLKKENSNKMIETKFIKNSAGEQLFVETFFADEVANSGEPKHTVVFLHGITGCRKGRTPADNYFQVLANKLAGCGFKVVLFDYSGHGDSEGNDYDVCLSKTLGELEAVFTAEVADKTKVSFLAFSYGAAVLNEFLKKHQDIKPHKIVFYSPCLYPNEQCFLSAKSIFGKDVVAAIERGEVKKNGFALVGAKGFKLGAKMLEECKGFKPDYLPNFAKNTLVLSGKQDVILGDFKLNEDFCKLHGIKNVYLNASHSLYECIDEAFDLSIKFLTKK